MLTLDSIVRRGALTNPEKIALIDGNLQWTWAEFDAAVTKTADALRRSGIAPGGRIAAADYTSAAYFALYFGAARLGAILCPLNYLSAPRELEYILHDFGPDLVLAGSGFFDTVATTIPRESEVLTFNDWWHRVESADANATVDAVDSDALHLVMYTSGTTGRAKGVAHTQTAHYLDGLNAALAYRLNPMDRYLVHAPSFHAASWDHAKIFLISDGSIVLLPRFEPVAAMDAITRHGVTVLFGVPAVLKMLMQHPSWSDYDLTTIRLVYYGGALGSPSILQEFAAALERDVDYMHVYGLTEGGPFVSYQPPERIFAKPDSIGWPIPGVEMAIADPGTGRHLPWGEIGEIVVRAPSNMAMYWNQPEETARVLRNGWLHTGDLGRRDQDGDFFIVDRLKDMIRTGGENVYAREVEVALLEHPAIADAAVIGLPDDRWDERVVAVVQMQPGERADEEEILRFCREYLARYKLPKQFVFVDEFPRTGLGKVSKHVLRDRLA